MSKRLIPYGHVGAVLTDDRGAISRFPVNYETSRLKMKEYVDHTISISCTTPYMAFVDTC